MRDAIVLLIIFAAVPVCLFNPYFGAVMWTWIAYFNPHRYTWGFAYNFPVAMVIAIPTLTGLMFARKLNKNIFTRETVLLLSLWAWYCITTFNVTQTSEFAGHADDAVTDLKIICKILLMAFVIILVTTS